MSRVWISLPTYQLTVREYRQLRKTFLQAKTKIVGVALLGFTLSSAALTLGGIRGAALIGAPLDVVVPVQMDAAEDVSTACFSAEVFHGDTPQDASHVRVLMQSSALAQTVNVRIVSSTAIDEPVVLVYLHAGCGQKTTRRYVLLPDLPSEIAAPVAAFVDLATAPAPTPAAVASAPMIAAATRSPVSAVGSSRLATAPVAAIKRAPAAPKSISPSKGSPQPKLTAGIVSIKQESSNEKAKAEQSAGQPRLKLDAAELRSDQVPALAASAPVAPSEELTLNLKKMQALEADLKALRASAARTQASLVDLKTRLQMAEAERFPASVVFALIAVALAALAAVALLWRRQRRTQSGDNNWWNGAPITQTPAPLEAKPQATPRSNVAGKVAEQTFALERSDTAALASASSDDSESSSQVDVSMIELGDSTFDELVPAAPLPVVGGAAALGTAASVLSASSTKMTQPAPTSALDLDLSDLEVAAVPPAPLAATVTESPLPHIDAPTDGQHLDAARSAESDNLIDFDFSEAPKPLTPAGHKPG